MNYNNTFTVIGLMSGTSLDGLDIVLSKFYKINDKWNFDIIKSTTYEYSNDWKKNLENSHNLPAYQFVKLHNEYGVYIGNKVNDFIKNTNIQIDLIASHGHTVFHQPDKNISWQIGNGAYIASTTQINTVSDFRTLDIAFGGQGAPLVPIGDNLLFSEYDYKINIGGFANISYIENSKTIAFDICPVNIVCNKISEKLALKYDDKGNLGRQGNIHNNLLDALNNIDYYNLEAPKSLSREWVENVFYPIVLKYNLNINDSLRTIYEHISIQFAKILNKTKNKKILITGGGVYNEFLIELIKQKTNNKVIIPDNNIIEYKEALIFGFLGILRYQDKVNCLSSVTGATKDNIGGVVHLI